MIMTLYNNKSDNRYVTKNITQLSILNNVYLKDPTEIIDPVIILDTFPSNCNYCKLNEFGRYYHKTEVTHENGLIKTHWHVDVLMSHINKLKDQYCILKRSATIYDMYLKDDETLLESYTKTRTIEFPNGFDGSTQQFILAVVGNTTDSNSGGGNNGE